MKQIGKERLDLPLTLMDSAQCFRWQEACGRFGAVLRGKPVWLWQDGDGIWAETALETAFVRQYLDLDRDYGALLSPGPKGDCGLSGHASAAPGRVGNADLLYPLRQ